MDNNDVETKKENDLGDENNAGSSSNWNND